MAVGVVKAGGVAAAVVAGLLLGRAVSAQVVAPAATGAQVTATAQGGTIKGRVVAGTEGKTGGIPLPGVAVTATQTLTGKKYATATGIDGAYEMTIPKNGRYVVRAELAGFATVTQEVVLTGVEAQAAAQAITIVPKPTDFAMELASRAVADEKAAAATGAARGLQSLSLSGGGLDASNASVAGTAGSGAAAPTLAGIDSSADSVAVSGQQGTTNGLANFSEDEIRSRIEDAVAQGRASGMIPQGVDTNGIVANVLGGMMGGRGPAGPGGGGGRGGPGGGGFGSGAFRNFNPAQPHGSIFYQVGNSALNSAPWSPSLQPVVNPSSYQNRYGLTIGGAPYIPGLTKPNTKQFVFLNLTGQKNLNAFLADGIVPTIEQRAGDFAGDAPIYDPATGMQFANNALTNVSPIAKNLLSYYPAPNLTGNAQGFNYQTVTNAGSNTVAINSRYVRNFGQATNTPFGSFGGGGGRRSGGANLNAPPTLRQNMNLSYNFSHSASDQRNIFLPLGGATESNGQALNAGYTVSYGRLSNNASVTWNRSFGETRNYFTDTENDPSDTVGFGGSIPNQTGGFADAHFYNGLPSINITNFQTLSNTTPSETVNQTISFSDFVAWRHKKHNMRYGLDVRRVHADSIGGNNPLGSFTFTGYATESPTDKTGATQNGSGNSFADFLLGLPETTSIQAGLYKTYLRENVYDWYVTDDYRVTGNVTLNYGLRYEYFGPYSEKNNRLVNLDHNADFTAFDTVLPSGVGMYEGRFPAGLVNPDKRMYSPRVGVAWKPKFGGALTKDVVVRGGYGINYNTGQYAVFARSLSHQNATGVTPFSATETNDIATPTVSNPNPTPTGCNTTTPSTPANLTLANGFGCSNNANAIQNNYAVDRNYRLGLVQAYNLNIQKTVPLQIVLNVGYNGSRGSNLDVVGTPNGTPSGTTTPGVSPFDYEESAAGSRSNQLVVSAQKRQQKGVALGVTYTYSHTIDNASGVGGAVGAPVQNFYRLDLEEGNASFDQRHNLTGNWVYELPVGPNRAFFNKGGVTSKLLDGFSVSGTFTFATGTYLTPQYANSQGEAEAGNTFTQRPDRVATQPLKGPGTYKEWFNTAAFNAPTLNGVAQYGSASQGSIEGPGTVSINASLSRTVDFGDTRSFEARVTANNVFNTVQYSGINVVEGTPNFGQVTSAAGMRSLLVQARYRF